MAAEPRSAERSAAYYGTPSGKAKKAQLNRKRRRTIPSAGNDPEASPSTEPEAKPGIIDAEPPTEIVEHVCVVTSLIEGFDVTREVVTAMLKRILR